MVDMPLNPTKPNPIYLIDMYKEDLALNNLKWLIYHKTQPNHLITKWYTLRPESILENEMHKITWDFEIQTDYLISARRPEIVLINMKKKTCNPVDFAVPAEHRMKIKESEKLKKILGHC